MWWAGGDSWPEGLNYVLLYTSDGFAPYLWSNDDFYREPRAKFSDDIARHVLDNLSGDWSVMEMGVWVSCQPSKTSSEQLPESGWKVHVSCTPSNHWTILGLVLDCMRENPTPFKVVGSSPLLRMLNAKWMSRTAAGKFITLYPGPDDFEHLLEALYLRLRGHSGAHILSDRRYKEDCQALYYRFGGIAPTYRLTSQGTKQYLISTSSGAPTPDVRTPVFAPPPGVRDPFEGRRRPIPAPGSVLIGGRYKVVSCIAFSASGGVYRAVDTRTGKTVIAKEARPNTGWDESGSDAVDRITREYQTLVELESASGFPRPLALVAVWEHLFLVETMVPGLRLNHFVASHHPLLCSAPDGDEVSEYRKTLSNLWRQLDSLVESAHRAGTCIGDISTNNIMVDGSELWVVDLESAYSLVDDSGPRRTPLTHGFMSESRMAGVASPLADDNFASAAVKMATIIPVNSMVPVAPKEALALVVSVGERLGIPSVDLDSVIGTLSEGWGISSRSLSSAICEIESRHLDIRHHVDECVRFQRRHANDALGNETTRLTFASIPPTHTTWPGALPVWCTHGRMSANPSRSVN